MDRKDRDTSRLFLIEGYRELTRALEGKRKIDTLFYCPSLFLGSNEKKLLQTCPGEHLECSEEVFRKLSYRDRPDGLIAIAHQVHLNLEAICLPKIPLVMIVEGIEKPGNLGTMVRTADAAGVDVVIVADPVTDIHNPNVVRSSVGCLFTVPVLQANYSETLSFVRKWKLQLVASKPTATLNYFSAPLQGPIALLMGCEQYGLSDKWLEEAEIEVKIPMFGKGDSLNVAQAAALLLYEIIRQKKYG